MITVARHDNWDRIEPGSLLELVGDRRMSCDYGFLFRHYWMPAATLTYERESDYRFGEDRTSLAETIVRQPGRCTADLFSWRETVRSVRGPSDGSGELDGLVRMLSGKEGEHLHIYDRSRQTFQTRGMTGKTARPESEPEARIQAMLRMPILTPLLPIPIGFRWHVEAENAHMEFVLESQENVGDMAVLFVRRRGRFSYDPAGTIHREGVTAYAPVRSVVLEDRIRDRIDERDVEVHHVAKLVRSAFKPQPEEGEA